jgi:hypothetical protein
MLDMVSRVTWEYVKLYLTYAAFFSRMCMRELLVWIGKPREVLVWIGNPREVLVWIGKTHRVVFLEGRCVLRDSSIGGAVGMGCLKGSTGINQPARKWMIVGTRIYPRIELSPRVSMPL